jgi:FMN-dependent NADH-azoreductase
MKNILHITASPRGNASFSLNFSQRIVERLRERAPEAVVVRRDFGAIGLAHIDETYGHTLAGSWPQRPDAYERPGSLAQSERLICELEAADAVVIGTPMHNYTVPSVLKAWIDHVLRAHRSFGFSAGGKVGLLADRPVYIAVASGGGYTREGTGAKARREAARLPHAVPGGGVCTIGIRDLHFFALQRTVMGADIVGKSVARRGSAARAHAAGAAGHGLTLARATARRSPSSWCSSASTQRVVHLLVEFGLAERRADLARQRVAHREHAQDLRARHQRQVAKAALQHQHDRIGHQRLGRHADRVGRHHLAHRRAVGVEPLGEHAGHQVALGQDAQQRVGQLHDEHAAAVGARHHAGGVAHAGLRAQADHVLARDRLENGALGHGAPS